MSQRTLFEWTTKKEWGEQRCRFVKEGDNVLLLRYKHQDGGWYTMHKYVSEGMLEAINELIDFATRG